MAEVRGREFINSEQYAGRLGAHPVVFRQAMAHKKGTLGSRGGSGYAPPGVRKLAERISPPTLYVGEGRGRPLWSVEEVEAFEAGRGRAGSRVDAPMVDGRVRRPAGLEGISDADIAAALADPRTGLTGRQAEVLRARLGLGDRAPAGPKALGAVGEELGVSRERVRQIELGAVAKLRDALGVRGAAS